MKEAEILVWSFEELYDFAAYDFEFEPGNIKPVFAGEKVIEIELDELDELEALRGTYGRSSQRIQRCLKALYND